MNIIENFTNLKFLTISVFSNTIGLYVVAFIVFVVLYLLIKLLESIILAKLRKVTEKTKTDFDDALVRVVDTINHAFYLFVAFYMSIQFLAIHSVIDKVLTVILIIWIVYEVVEALDEMMAYFIDRKAEVEDDKSAAAALSLARRLAKGTLWVIGILLVLSNLGINITSLVAGLGIGGVAVALAAKELLGDLFSSFSIYFDKPFVVGDLIVVGEVTGHVEKIGVKTTRIRSLKGEEVIISNQKLTNAKIENYKKMNERRIVFSIGIDYDTPQDTLKRIPDMISKAVDETDGTRIDRSNLSEFGDSAIKIETVYYVESQDYSEYRNKHEQILLKIREAFKKEGISMPFPTQTIYVQGKLSNE